MNLDNKNKLLILDDVIQKRPLALQCIDQVYMKKKSMFDHLLYLKDYFSSKNVLFLGDGDSISIAYHRFFNATDKEAVINVLDMDERVLNNYRNQSQPTSVFNTMLYNVIDPIDTNLKNAFNIFHINPPYGSQNKGMSCIIWLYRIMELCTDDAEGFILIPHDISKNWTIESFNNILEFLKNNGFEILEVNYNKHYYNSPWEPDLTSSVVHVKRVANFKSKYENKKIPLNDLKYLYGKDTEILYFIKDNNTEYGLKIKY